MSYNFVDDFHYFKHKSKDNSEFIVDILNINCSTFLLS